MSETPAHLKFMDGDDPKQTEYTQGFYKGSKWQMERIIKLLEDKGAHEWHDGHEEITCDTCWNIALIKGENK
jgi:hypothetical protein